MSASSFYTFQYVPRTRRLTPDQKTSLDNYSRFMAQKMMEIQDDYRYMTHLAEHPEYTSDSEASSPTSSKPSTPPMLIANPFFNPELAEKIKKEQQRKSVVSPTGVQLVPNPFFNPNSPKKCLPESPLQFNNFSYSSF